jgi:hypothetical protein
MPMPAIYPTRNFVGAGGPMNYGANNSEAYRQAAAYAGWILKGEKPANLPVLQATKVKLVYKNGEGHESGCIGSGKVVELRSHTSYRSVLDVRCLRSSECSSV